MYKLINFNSYRLSLLSAIRSRSCHTSNVIIGDVALEKNTQNSKSELVPRKYCKN